MKRILILSMSCNDSFFKHQSMVVRDTWAKPVIDGAYDNIMYCAYDGMDIDAHTYDTTTHTLHLRVEDDIDNTFKKTYYALSVINNTHLFDYDYVFRTNTSTMVNVPLLNAFVQSLKDDTVLWTSELYSLSEACVPYPLYLYGRGNGLLMSRKLVDIVIDEGLPFLYQETCDDTTIGNILNSHWIRCGEDYLSHIKAYKHGWYRCVPAGVGKSNNSLCQYNNEDRSMEFMSQFLTVQIKRYRERDIEDENYHMLWETFKSMGSEEAAKHVDEQYAYAENPNVFIGSILGYIPYDGWIRIDRNRLYEIEINNKASDDAERYKEKRILY